MSHMLISTFDLSVSSYNYRGNIIIWGEKNEKKNIGIVVEVKQEENCLQYFIIQYNPRF